jgi:hypothetical protein
MSPFWVTIILNSSESNTTARSGFNIPLFNKGAKPSLEPLSSSAVAAKTKL